MLLSFQLFCAEPTELLQAWTSSENFSPRTAPAWFVRVMDKEQCFTCGLDSSTQPAWNSVQSCSTPAMPYDTWTFGVAELIRAIHTLSFCTTTDLQALAEHSIPASHSMQHTGSPGGALSLRAQHRLTMQQRTGRTHHSLCHLACSGAPQSEIPAGPALILVCTAPGGVSLSLPNFCIAGWTW